MGVGLDTQAAFGTAPTRCLRVRGKDEKAQAQLPPSLPKSPSWVQPVVLGRGVREGQRKGRQRVEPENKSHVRRVEKESGDRARGKRGGGAGAQS